MGCCTSSPHARRIYRDPADRDEIYVDTTTGEEIIGIGQDDVGDGRGVYRRTNGTSTGQGQQRQQQDRLPLRTFGRYRNNGVMVPDDIDGLPSSHLYYRRGDCRNDNTSTATDSDNKHGYYADTLLYEAELDNGRAWRCFRPAWAIVPLWPAFIGYALSVHGCTCDEICCYVSKEYSTRAHYRVYPNRIEINEPYARIPFGYMGCGSWNGDNILTHPYDRGAFGFRRIKFGVCGYLLCLWPCYGDVVARQRCQCNGPPWPFSSNISRGWWCDEWPCDMMCCSYRYTGISNGDEVAAASNFALQAYYEGRRLTSDEMQECMEYWRTNVSEEGDPVARKRPVMCEEHTCGRVPCCFTGFWCYKNICQCQRGIPKRYVDQQQQQQQPTDSTELRDAYDNYESKRQQQTVRYETYTIPQRLSTVCQALGCKQCFGRKGCLFCTEGCCDSSDHVGCCYQKLNPQSGDPFPPFATKPNNNGDGDWDDDHDAARMLQQVLGNPPSNVQYMRWEMEENSSTYTIVEVAQAVEAATAAAPAPSHPFDEEAVEAPVAAVTVDVSHNDKEARRIELTNGIEVDDHGLHNGMGFKAFITVLSKNSIR